jgi:hypothetical protein
MKGQFSSYPKIHRLGKEETDGILDGPVTVQEKLDGANVSIWLGEDGEVRCGSRTRDLGDEEFNGFPAYVKANSKIRQFLVDNPDLRFYGEWLVKHTLAYPDTACRKVYLFDVYDERNRQFWLQAPVATLAASLDLGYPEVFAADKELTADEVKEYVGKSFIAENGEGVVVKHPGWVNKFGDHSYAKVVHQRFKENNAIVFGGNDKHSETYWEMWVVNKYCTLARVTKIMQKLQPEIDHRLDMAETSQIGMRCYHDLITEEAWEIVKKVPALNFKKLQGLAMRKFIQIYHDVLNDSLSVADSGKEAA